MYYSDITYAAWIIESPATRLFVNQFVQPYRKEDAKFHVIVPLWREPSMTDGFPSQMASNAESVSILSCHHVEIYV